MLTISVLFETTFCFAGAVEALENFYKAYIRCELDGKMEEAASLKNRALSPACREKLGRITAATDCDPLLRAQDVNSDMLESICVKEIGNGWYIVSYYWDRTKRSTLQLITLKARLHNESLVIEYVTPEWNHFASGDNTIRGIDRECISYKTGSDFLRSFYSQYLSVYCDMEDRVLERLEDCCLHYCTKRAMKEIHDIQSKYSLDGGLNYDPFIDGSDFDVSWYESMTIIQEGATYNVQYFDGNIHSIDISLVKKGGCYYIDHICPQDPKPLNPNYVKSSKAADAF